MNKRFLSTLLFGALFIASTSMFVSCKDYDDDIKNLQTQIDKAALKSQLDASDNAGQCKGQCRVFNEESGSQTQRAG